MVSRVTPKESSSQLAEDLSLQEELGVAQVKHEYFSIEGTLKSFLQDPKVSPPLQFLSVPFHKLILQHASIVLGDLSSKTPSEGRG